LQDQIKFTDIHAIIEKTMMQIPLVEHPGYEDYVACNAEARERAASIIKNL
jgi:1-deoxy-D-xylulose 5-phosphate reductoisomerase